MDKMAFSVFDSAADMFLEPFFAPTIEFALRGFREAVNQEGHQFAKFPQDYVLFHIGSFNVSKGELTSMAPHSLGVAISFIERNNDA